nr:nucleotidyltransferase [Achromobacter sp. ES-001]
MALRNLKFLVVGGWAVNLHGAHRPTKDLDIWVSESRTDMNALEESLTFSGIAWDAAALCCQELHGPKNIARIGPPVDVDIVSQLNGLVFEDSLDRLEWFIVDGLRLPVICKNHLIITKSKSEGQKHLDDVHALRS